MTPASIPHRARAVAMAASLLLIADLFVGWQRTTVRVPGAVDLQATNSGWTGWGLVAGVLAVVVAVLALAGLRGRAAHGGATLLAACGLLAATALAVLTGNADVRLVAGAVGVEVQATRWPAWAALALAVVVAAACLVASLTTPESGPRTRDVGPRAPVAR
jgi:hypothetical protein